MNVLVPCHFRVSGVAVVFGFGGQRYTWESDTWSWRGRVALVVAGAALRSAAEKLLVESNVEMWGRFGDECSKIAWRGVAPTPPPLSIY